MRKALYPWQEECLQRWFENQCRGMVQAVTGSGKTFLALNAMEQLEESLTQELHIKIVVPSGGLMRQWERSLKKFLSDSHKLSVLPAELRLKIGLRGAGCKMPADRKYMIYVINSARYELARQILWELKNGIPVLLIADECHHYESEQNRLIFEFLPYLKPSDAPFFSLGLSATLPSEDAQGYLSSVLGKKIYSYEMKKATAMHSICPYDIYHISLSFQKTEQQKYSEITEQMQRLYRSLVHLYPILKNMNQKDLFHMLTILANEKNQKTAQAASAYLKLSYKRKSLVCLASARTSCACELVERLPGTEKVLIFSERICQADELYQLLQERYPEKIGRCHSQMGQTANQNALNRFRDGSLRILIACKSIDEGIDIPDASIGIILSGTSMQRQRIQRLGRIIRNAEGKGRAALYYLHLAGTAEEHCFLPDINACNIHELYYQSKTKRFVNPLYDQAAKELQKNMQLAGISPDKLHEVKRCIDLGSIRSDWTLKYDEFEQRISSSSQVNDKNYWICMKKLAELITEDEREPAVRPAVTVSAAPNVPGI